MGELTPCPFCGSIQDQSIKNYHDSMGVHYYVECWNCGSRGPRHNTEELAGLAWDTREQVTEPYKGKACGHCAWTTGKTTTIEDMRGETFCRSHSTWLRCDTPACPDWRSRC